MTHDERLVPAREGRDLDRSLADLTQTKPYGRYGNTASDINLKEYLFVVLKRKWLIMSLVLVITSLATIQAYREPSIYEGATTIKIEQKAQSILQSGSGGIVIGQNDPNFWGTQLKLLQNPTLARQVVVTLNLQHNPRFFGPQGQSSIFASLKRIFSREKVVQSPTQNGGGTAPINEETLKERQLTAEEQAALEPYEDTIVANEIVEPVAQTNLVIIRYRHTDPLLAQKIADTLADVFIANNVERQESGTSKAAQDLAQEIAKYQEQVKKKQADIFNYAKTYELPLTDAPSSNLRQQRVATYSAQLLEAENTKRSLQAAYEAAKNSADPFANPEVQKDERIIHLRQKISDLKDKESGLLQKYTPEWPEVQQVQAQIRALEAELKKGPGEVLAAMKAKADASSTQLEGLKSAYAKESGLTAQQTKNVIELASMRADFASDQQYLNTLFQKRRELNAVSGTGGTNVSVQNYSRRAALAGPQRMRTIVIALILSLFAGIGLAFLLDFLDDTIKSVDDISRYINLPSLALIPAARSDKPRLRGGQAAGGPSDTTALAMVQDVRSPIAESYRHLRTSLLLSSAGTPPRTILVTSSQPSEGKTTTAINTAFILAQTGVEVLIIDCDLRRPRLHAHFNMPNARGLTNALSGDAGEIDNLIQTCEQAPNLKVLTSGPMPPNPAELLGSEEMRKLLRTLSEKFIHVIVDSPPAISFTDASILSTFVDGVILVVHGGRSSRAVVRRAKQQLLDIGANIFGVVLNNVKMESKSNYYYTGYYDYYGSDEEAPDEESSRAASN
ncbi:MAG TPA: polysaccharide biosynthesis tyrosine autokinase [Candidatus Udaeobacter sp.]|jgi:capsular exopolysaccharide family|nr:polysaccharide biosynthesis tyrosine autokinase [Candidatus Udaeobacter sp.]